MIHKVITFRVGIVRLFLYLDNEGKEYKGGGDKRKGFAEVGELIQKLDCVLDGRILPQLVCGDTGETCCLGGHCTELAPITGFWLK
jgi:hypothetical protein